MNKTPLRHLRRERRRGTLCALLVAIGLLAVGPASAAAAPPASQHQLLAACQRHAVRGADAGLAAGRTACRWHAARNALRVVSNVQQDQLDVQLVTAPYLREGAYAPIRVRVASDGPHELRGEGVMAVRWHGAGEIVLPVLVLEVSGGSLHLEVDRQPAVLDVAPLSPRERLVIDATASLSAAEARSLGQRMFPEGDVRVIAAQAVGAPVAYELADAVLFAKPPPSDEQEQWLAAGVAIAVLSQPVGDEWRSLNASGEGGPWCRLAPPFPRVREYEPDVYAAVSAWHPGRPVEERRAVALGCLAFILLVILSLWAFRSARGQVLALVLISAASVGAAALWMSIRPDVAVRQADLRITQPGRPDALDRWLFLKAPAGGAPVSTRIAFAGSTRPLPFDEAHWRALASVLQVNADGTPVELSLTLPPAFTAAVLQRTAGATRPSSSYAPWARPLLRQWYAGRLGAFELEETDNEALLRLP